MNAVDIPDFGTFDIEHIVCDFNGTLAVDGELLPGVAESLNELARSVQVHVVTADTFGSASARCKVDCRIHLLRRDDQRHAKLAYLFVLGPQSSIAIGNGRNDVDMLRVSRRRHRRHQRRGRGRGDVGRGRRGVQRHRRRVALLHKPKRLLATLRA